ncbi:hypothetical protein C0J52_25662 [Blattella germanica]|nr:hypothetical protein C0J52_25662 [Blattella germanica]
MNHVFVASCAHPTVIEFMGDENVRWNKISKPLSHWDRYSVNKQNSLMCHFEGEYMKFCSKKLWLDMSTISHTAHIPPKVNFLPYSLKHIGRHSLNCSGDTMSKLYGPFFFQEQTITGIIYLDMLQNYLIPQI